MKRVRVRLDDVAATAVQAAGVVVAAIGLEKVYEPLGWLAVGAFLGLLGYSLTPKPDEKQERGPEYR